nr:hypothetical protein [uncultured Rhodoferax sp.]
MNTKSQVLFLAKLGVWAFVSFGLFFVLLCAAESHAPLLAVALGRSAPGITNGQLMDALTLWAFGLPAIFLLSKGLAQALLTTQQ